MVPSVPQRPNCRRAPLVTSLLATCLAASRLLAAGDLPLNPFQIPPGGSITIEFQVTVDSPLGSCAGQLSNQGFVSAAHITGSLPTDDPDSADALDATRTNLALIDLKITKSDGSPTEVPGTPVTYTIQVENEGSAAAFNAIVFDDFPATITDVTWSCVGTPGATCTAGGSGDINESVNIPAGGSVTFTATGNIAADATGTLANTATVTRAANQTECDLTDNSSTDTDPLNPQADVAITKTNGVPSTDAGGSTTYTIVASNAGPSTATSVTVADTFPAVLSGCSTTSVAAGGATGNEIGPVAGNINDAGITLPPGASVTYSATCNVSGSASGSLVNTATVTSATTDPNAGNNSATDVDTINPVADLSVTKTDGVSIAVPGMSVTYTIVASNSGPATATNATVTDNFPVACASVSWTCVGAGGGTCTAGPIAGNIAHSVTLPANSSATYTAVCTLADAATGTLVNTVSIAGGGVSDTATGNNTATDTDTILPLDYGDAPNAVLGSPWAYPTVLADDGARHGFLAPNGLRLGAQLDTEANGQPTLAADGDDQIAGINVDDEDGVTLPTAFVTCETVSVTVVASAAARLDAFVDWNRNGSFADAGEKIFDNQAIVAGPNSLSVSVPCGATPTAQTFARFRISTAGGLTPLDVAADGEVEDYQVVVRGLDLGDAPDPTYPTLLASNGARHVVTGSGPVLGSAPDAEPNGQPTGTASGDDAAGADDEDGVTLTGPFVRGQSAPITVNASAAGVLNAWVDWNSDGNWTTPGDAVLVNQAVVAGPNALNIAVPASASSGINTVARFRLATAGGLSFTGLANDGEVEDHALATAAEADVSITKTDGSATEIPGTTVTYTIVASNAGPNPATGVVVLDAFPASLSGCTWSSTAAGGATGNDAGPVAGNINDTGITLPSGSSVTYTATCTIAASATGTLENTATVSTATFDPNTGNNTATDSDTLVPEADLAITKTDGSATEVPGTPVTYTIVATNAGGPSVATGVTVTDNFPGTLSGCSWTSVAAGGATGNDAGPIAGNIGDSGITLPPGGSVTYTGTCNVAASATGTLVNVASVASAVADPSTGNNSATDTDTLTPQADLAISKTDGSATEVPGTTVTYTIVATNTGPSNATGATVTDNFPGTITGVNWSCVGAGGGTCPAGGSGNIGALVNVPVGGSVTFTATGTIASSATGSLANTASVAPAAGTTDGNGANDSATDTDTLEPSADLRIVKDDSADPPPAGEDLIYTLTVTNLGPSDATGVDVSDPLPAEVTYVSDDCGGVNGSPWVWAVGALAANASVTCEITVSIDPAPPETITNTASVEASTPDPVLGNNEDTELTQLDAVAPSVTNVNSVADTGDGTLAECESTSVIITSLRITFDEPMRNPAGDTEAGDVTNPSSYLLVTPGPDFDFQTTGCGGAAGDDVAVGLSSVTYDDGSDTATLALASPLASAQHRLFACDDLTDLAGNPLDGDGDTDAGGDFSRAFRADPGNLFANGHFDCDISGWNEIAANPAEISWTALEDADDADASGSVLFTNLAPGIDTSFALWQCYPISGTPTVDLEARVRLDAAPGDFIGFTRRCEFYSGANCTASLGAQSTALVLSDTADAWLPLASSLGVPAGAVSARCDFRFETPTGRPFDAYLDATIFAGDADLFLDGFESGNTAAWSSAVP